MVNIVNDNTTENYNSRAVRKFPNKLGKFHNLWPKAVNYEEKSFIESARR